jgi:hypothetical protein
MTRTAPLFGLAALLAAALLLPTARAADPELKGEEVLKELRELRREVAELRKARDRDSRLLAAEMRLLDERLERLERNLARLAPTVTTRVSSSFTPEGRLPRGSIRLDNRLGVTASVVVNGVPHSVSPGSVLLLRDQPAGPFTYEVAADGWAIRPPARSSVTANETLTLVIYDPRR